MLNGVVISCRLIGLLLVVCRGMVIIGSLRKEIGWVSIFMLVCIGSGWLLIIIFLVLIGVVLYGVVGVISMLV